MNKIYVLALSVLLTGCTISFTNVDTHGTASDVVDDTMSTPTTVSPDITVPISPISGL